MSVCANGHLIYGFFRNDENDSLFSAISTAWKERETDEEDYYSFEEMHKDLQTKHHISLESVGYDGIDLLQAFGACASGKNMDVESINAEDLAKTAEYDQRIKDFLEALGIPSDTYTPGWHLLSYMD